MVCPNSCCCCCCDAARQELRYVAGPVIRANGCRKPQNMSMFLRRGFGFTSVAMWEKAGTGAVALSSGALADRGGTGAWGQAGTSQGPREAGKKLGSTVILSSQELPPNTIPNFLSLACLFNKLILFNLKVHLMLGSVSGAEGSRSLKLPSLERHDSETEKLAPLHHQGLLAKCKGWSATQENEVLVRKNTKWLIFHH